MNAAPRRIAHVGLGSNLLEPATQVARALAALDEFPHTRVLRRSRAYRCAPWGMLDQPDFVNAAARIETSLSARELMDALLDLEQRFGRDRSRGERWGPRVLDLDLLEYGGLVLGEPGLCVPHPRLHERAFVLVPLAEIAPDLMIPGHGRVADLLARVDASQCHSLAAA